MAATSSALRAQLHAPHSALELVTSVLLAAGLRPSAQAEVALLVTEHDRPGMADQWLVDSLPHLVVRVSSERIRIGPFVDPGVTACLRCLAAAGAPAAPPAPAPADVDPAMLTIGLGWAVRDLATWQAGGLPTTWSRTITIGADLDPVVDHWQRHPHCGCCWGVLDGVG